MSQGSTESEEGFVGWMMTRLGKHLNYSIPKTQAQPGAYKNAAFANYPNAMVSASDYALQDDDLREPGIASMPIKRPLAPTGDYRFDQLNLATGTQTHPYLRANDELEAVQRDDVESVGQGVVAFPVNVLSAPAKLTPDGFREVLRDAEEVWPTIRGAFRVVKEEGVTGVIDDVQEMKQALDRQVKTPDAEKQRLTDNLEEGAMQTSIKFATSFYVGNRILTAVNTKLMTSGVPGPYRSRLILGLRLLNLIGATTTALSEAAERHRTVRTVLSGYEQHLPKPPQKPEQ